MLICLIPGCPGEPITPEKLTKSAPLAPPIAPNLYWCSYACATLKYLGCYQGFPVDVRISCKDNDSCVEGQICSIAQSCMIPCTTFCMNSNIENRRVFSFCNPACIAEITNCNQINLCVFHNPKCNGDTSCSY